MKTSSKHGGSGRGFPARHRLYVGLFVTLAAWTAGCPAWAQEPPAKAEAQHYSIAAGALGDALDQLAAQSHLHIVYAPELVQGKTVPSINGQLTWQQALGKLLAGNDLEWRVVGDGLVVIRKKNAAPAHPVKAEGKVSSLPAVLVLGSVSQNLDIERTEDEAQHYVVFTRQEIESSQATTLDEFFRTRLPMNTVTVSSAQNVASSSTQIAGSPYSSIDLRGLGTDETLILVDGRRMADIGSGQFGPTQADINGIPLSAIERIEVLPSSASGIYGGHAIGGVINIILRHDYTGLEVGTTFQDTTDFHAPLRRVDITGGLSLQGGKTSIVFNASASGAGTMTVKDRPYLVENGYSRYLNNNPSYADYPYPPLGAGVNIHSADGSDLVLNNGTPLNSSYTSLPSGYKGVASDGGAALVANAGTYNTRLPQGGQGLERSLFTQPTQKSFSVSVNHTFTPWLTGILSYSDFQNNGNASTGNAPFSASLPAGVPTNPFQQPVNVSFDTPNLNSPDQFHSYVHRLTLGSTIRLPHTWGINVDFTRNWTMNRSIYQTTPIDSVGEFCALAGTPANQCPSYYGGSPTDNRPILNPLMPVNFDPYLLPFPTNVSGPYKSTENTPSIRAAGPVFKLPGGYATLTLAVEQDSSNIGTSFDYQLTSSRQNLTSVSPARSQRNTSEYAEIALPIVDGGNIPFLQELDLDASVRHDDYVTHAPPAEDNYIYLPSPDAPIPSFSNVSTHMRNTNFTLAGHWSPVDGVALRSSYATGFLPPNVMQLSSFTQLLPGYFPPGADPLRGYTYQTTPYTMRSGYGNPDLKPETSRSLSEGIILTPGFLDGFRFSIDYTVTRKKNEIVPVPVDFMLAHPELFPGRLTRGDRLPGDPSNWAGVITYIDLTPINAGKTLVKSWDYKADYRFQTQNHGGFHFYLAATFEPELKHQYFSNTATLDSAGNADGPIKWRGNGGVDWILGNLKLGWNAQYYSRYNIYSTLDPTLVGYEAGIAQAIQFQGAARVPSQIYHDVFASYMIRKPGSFLDHVTISGGIQNLFNTRPPIIATVAPGGNGYSPLGDPRLRRFQITVKKAFGKD